MKKIYSLILLLLLTAITFSFVSCSSRHKDRSSESSASCSIDDDSISSDPTVSYSRDNDSTPSDDNASLLIGSWKWEPNIGDVDEVIMTFKSDGTYIEGEKRGTYQVSGNVVKISGPEFTPVPITIISISKSALVLEILGIQLNCSRISD